MAVIFETGLAYRNQVNASSILKQKIMVWRLF